MKVKPSSMLRHSQTAKQMEVIQNLKKMVFLLVKMVDEKFDISGKWNQRLQEEHKGEIASQAYLIQRVNDVRQIGPWNHLSCSLMILCYQRL